MSTIVPNCTITYPKDLSFIKLNINVIEFPDIYNAGPLDIKLTIKKDGITTNVNDMSIINHIIPINVLTGTLSCNSNSTTIFGNGTIFLSEIKPGDYIQFQSPYTRYVNVHSVSDDLYFISNTEAIITENGIEASVLRPTMNIYPSDMFNGVSLLPDGLYEFYFKYNYGSFVSENSKPFKVYVFANQYNCVESKLMNLALYCSEGCVDMETLKNTLLLKALLDAMEISINESDTATTQLIKDKIDRYCLLLNNNCTSC